MDAAAAVAAFGAAAGGLIYPAAGDVQGVVAVDAVARLAVFGAAADGMLYPAGDGEAVAGGNACAAGVVLAGAGGVAALGLIDDTDSDFHGLAKDAFAAALAFAALCGSDGVGPRVSAGALGDGELTVTVDAVAAVAGAIGRIAAGGVVDSGALGDVDLAVAVDAAAAALAGAALRFFDFGVVLDGEYTGAVDAVAAAHRGIAALGVLDEGLAGDLQAAAAEDACAAVRFAVAALRVSDGGGSDGELLGAVDAVAAFAVAGICAGAALGVYDFAARDVDLAVAVDAVAAVCSFGSGSAESTCVGIGSFSSTTRLPFADGAALDGEVAAAVDARAAALAGAALRFFDFGVVLDGEYTGAVDAVAAAHPGIAALGVLDEGLAGDLQVAVAVDAGAAVPAAAALRVSDGGARDGERLGAVDAVAAVAVGAAAGGVAALRFFDGTVTDFYGGLAGGLAKDAFAAVLACAALRGFDGAAIDGELVLAVDAVAAGAGAFAALGVYDFAARDVDRAVAVDAVAAFCSCGSVSAESTCVGIGSFTISLPAADGAAGDGEVAFAVDAVAGVTVGGVTVAAAADGADNGGFAGNGEGLVAVDAVAGVAEFVTFAALCGFDGAALNLDGNIRALAAVFDAAAADAVAEVAAGGVLDGAARDGDCGRACSVKPAADAGTTAAALRFFDSAAIDGDCGLACSVRAAADAGTALIGLRLDYFGSAGDGDIGFAGSSATAANAGTIGVADGGDVAACYLNVAGTGITVVCSGGVPDAADASRGQAACGSQAAGVVAFAICFGCDGQFAGVLATIALFVVLEAGMEAAAGEGIAALERDRRVALALDAEGGVTIGLIFLVAGIDVDILQRHVEGAVFDLVDDSDDVAGDVFGCALEAFEHVLHGLGRVVPVIIVVIGVGDIEGWAGVHELASRHRASALRAFGKGLAAGGGVGLVLFRGIGLVFLAAGGVAGLAFVFLVAGGVVAGLVFVFLVAGGVVVGLGLFFLVAAVRRHVALGVVFLAAAVRRAAALGVGLFVAEVDLFFGFAVFFCFVFCFERGQIGLGGRLCEGAAGGGGII